MTTGYQIAKTLLGLQEHRDKDKLMELFKSQGLMSPTHPKEVFNPDGVDEHGLPWCAAFVTHCERVARGDKVKIRYAARDFLKYGEDAGKDLTKAKEGDILVFTRGNNSYSGHVTYFVSVDKKSGLIKCLGANQNDAVSIAFYKPSGLLGIRRII
tara:strand:- start:325 stop:789 length:465 start_codon:yes stop_codon:yes gene_type:complete